MNLFRSIQTALSNLRANKLRSALTMLGVIIGVSAVILMVSIVEGARFKVVQEFERLGSSLIIIVYQPNPREMKTETRRIDGMTMRDVETIRRECDLVKNISAELDTGSEHPARRHGREYQVRTTGVQPDYEFLRDTHVSRGRFITDDDMRQWAKVCVIGDKVRAELFGGEDPIGQEMDVQGVNLTVVGVLKRKGGAIGGDEDKRVVLPITTVQKRYVGRDLVGVIYAQPENGLQVPQAMDQVWRCLMRRHDNVPGFHVDSQENILNSIGRILTIFGLLVGSVSGLSLLVGGIGIMNIMLVSVTERTREIGIRKAVGARRKDILVQFLIEAATLSGIGGLMGIGLGAGTAYLAGAVSREVMSRGMFGPNSDPGIPVHLPMWAVLGAFGFSASIGIIFGVYPAIRAARLDPIAALRHE